MSSIIVPSSANRRGEITPEQREALKHIPTRLVPLMFIAVVFFCFLFVNIVTAMRLSREMENAVGPFAVLVGITLGIAFAFLDTRMIKRGLQRRIEQGARPQPVEGEVKWRLWRYVAVADGKRLKLVDSAKELVPGSYRFYVLEGTRWILSLERLENRFTLSADESPNPELLWALAVTNGFVRGALALNREGRLSMRQRFMLLRRTVSRVIGWMIVAAVVALFIPFGAQELLETQFKTTLDTPQMIVIGLIAFILLTPLILWRLVRNLLEVLGGRVMIETGIVHRESDTRGEDEVKHYYRYETYRFPVSLRAYNALVSGERYTLYITPLSETLVNIEPAMV